MRHCYLTIVALAVVAAQAGAQDFMIGGPTLGGSEPLYAYDDPEVWKHGWIQIMPYYGGHHTFRPYNYKQVFSQSAQAAAWGMPKQMPYSQQYYHRYENLTDTAIPPLSSMQPAPYGPHPSAMHQPQWGQLQRTAVTTAGFDHRPGAAFPRAIAPMNFHGIHQSPAAGPEQQRRSLQDVRIQHLLQEARSRPMSPHEPIPAPAAAPE